jgi:hypothetical protein
MPSRNEGHCTLATLLLLFPFGIWQFLVFDRLIRYEYENFREAWEHDGSPHGFFWHPPRPGCSTSIMRYMARDTLAVMWLVVTPSWMEKDEKARSLLSRLRWLWLGFVFIGIPAFALANLVIMALTER